jgi:hypothetical protein
MEGRDCGNSGQAGGTEEWARGRGHQPGKRRTRSEEGLVVGGTRGGQPGRSGWRPEVSGAYIVDTRTSVRPPAGPGRPSWRRRLGANKHQQHRADGRARTGRMSAGVGSSSSAAYAPRSPASHATLPGHLFPQSMQETLSATSALRSRRGYPLYSRPRKQMYTIPTRRDLRDPCILSMHQKSKLGAK